MNGSTRRAHRLRLGTRRSRLAIAQTRQVAALLEAQHPDLSTEIVLLSSPGDRDLRTPLTAVAAADFFSADLDTALLQGAIDACVHSWKDIVGERPAGLCHAATPPREVPHDVVLFRGDIDARLMEERPLRIGSCSLRRRLNTADFLRTALPASPARERIDFVDIRGAVDQRVERLSTAAGDDRLDGIVLALAGLQRLYADPDGRAALGPALTDVRWMVLPLSACPAAPAQGALAIDCRADDTATLARLAAIDHPLTRRLVELELTRAAEWGAASERVGVTARPVPELEYVLWERGRQPDGRSRATVSTGIARPRPTRPVRAWRDRPLRSERQALRGVEVRGRHVFLAHADALQSLQLAADTRVWTSGVASWQRLAERGLWIEGCGDNLGFGALAELLATPVLQLPRLSEWVAVTHADAVAGWAGSGVGTVTASYRLGAAELDSDSTASLSRHNHFYWDSARQFHAVRPQLPPSATHACGAGKTLAALRAAGIDDVLPFVSRREWQAWLN